MEIAMPLPRDRWLVWGTYGVAAALWVLAWAPVVLARIAADDFSNYDLGIYSQALYLLSWHDPNPWLTVRNINVFNDHFDPILWVAAPLAKVFEPAYAGALFEMAAVLASPTAVVWLWRRGQMSAPSAAVATAYMLHNRGTINAVLYPIHPTTWAILPFAWVGAAIVADRRGGLLAALLILFCCKEEFAAVGLMAAALYACRGEFRFPPPLATFSAAWMAGVVFLRPALLGPVQDYVSGRLFGSGGGVVAIRTRLVGDQLSAAGARRAPLAAPGDVGSMAA